MNYEEWKWADYFYSDTYDKDLETGTLRNLYGLHSSNDLREWEYEDTYRRASELRANPGLIVRTYDAAHLKAIHAYLFQDVYEWAGRIVLSIWARVTHSSFSRKSTSGLKKPII